MKLLKADSVVQAEKKPHRGYRVFAGFVFLLVLAFYGALWWYYRQHRCLVFSLLTSRCQCIVRTSLLCQIHPHMRLYALSGDEHPAKRRHPVCSGYRSSEAVRRLHPQRSSPLELVLQLFGKRRHKKQY